MTRLARFDRWRRWSVAALGVLSFGVIIGIIAVTRPELTALHRLQIGSPAVLALGLIVYGGWLARGELPTEQVTRIVLWCLAGAVVIGSFAAWELSLDIVQGKSVAETVHVLLRGGTEGALGGGLVGYYDVRRREQHQKTERANRAITTSIDGIALLDEDERYTEVNQAHADVYGYERPEAFIAESWQMCYTDAELEHIEEEVMPALREAGHWRGELTGKRRDGGTFPQAVTMTVSNDGGMVCVTRDITERKRREQQLNTLHEATRDMMDATTRQEVAEVASEAGDDILDVPVNIHLYDEDASGLAPFAISPQTEAVVGDPPTIRKGEGIAWRVFESGDPEFHDDVRTAPGVLNPETPIRSEGCLPLGDHGVLIAASTTIDAFDDAAMSLVTILAANIETALDRARREQELRIRERELEHQNDRLDEFADLVSHDLRNPLAVAMGRLDLARETGDDEHFEEIADAQSRMEEIIENVLTLAREGDVVGDTELVDLDTVARRAWDNVETGTASFECDTDQEIKVDASNVGRLFENLFRNAIEHGGEEVTVRLGRLADRAGFYIEDTGAGIPREHREHVFESGYTTDTESTGFGLAIVEEIVMAHRWEIDVTDGADGGARFEVTTEPGID